MFLTHVVEILPDEHHRHCVQLAVAKEGLGEGFAVGAVGELHHAVGPERGAAVGYGLAAILAVVAFAGVVDALAGFLREVA